MPASPQAVANAFLQLAHSKGKRLTNMQLQKLVFLAQGYALAILDRCIYDKNTHAWQWGPVIPKLYKSLQKYGSGEVTEEIPAQDSVQELEDKEIIEGVWDSYSMYTAAQLSNITHREGSPWAATWEREQFGIIQVEDIQDYYRKLVAAA